MERWERAKLFGLLNLYYFCALVFTIISLGVSLKLYYTFSKEDSLMIMLTLSKSVNSVQSDATGLIVVLTTVLLLAVMFVYLGFHIMFCLWIVLRKNPHQVEMKYYEAFYIAFTGTIASSLSGGAFLVVLVQMQISEFLDALTICCFAVVLCLLYLLSVLLWINYVRAGHSMFSKKPEMEAEGNLEQP